MSSEQAQVELLTGPDAEGLLATVLHSQGAHLVSWSVHQVHHRPGVGVTVGYEVEWRAQSDRQSVRQGVRQGVRPEHEEPPTTEYLLASTAAAAAGPRTVLAEVDGHEVRVWRHPADPALPALTRASTPADVAALLGVDPQELVLELVTYRPLRRAVLRARTPAGTTYLKVVRPHTVEALHTRHQVLAAAGLPVAGTTSHPDGLLVMTALTGAPLTDAFAADGAAEVDPAALLSVLDRMPAECLDLPARPSWTDRVLDHADAAALAVPARGAEVRALAQDLAALVATTDPGPLVPTHGDLHEANLLMAQGRVVGLLDVDQVGPGRRVDDLACLLGHLSVLPSLAPEVHRHVHAALPRWVSALEADVDPVGLRARAGAVALSLVAGAGTAADAAGRLAAAHRWYDEALSLRDLSSRRPAGLILADDSRGVPEQDPAPRTAAHGLHQVVTTLSLQQGEGS